MKIDKQKDKLYLSDSTGGDLFIGYPTASNYVLTAKYGYEDLYVQNERVRIDKKRLDSDFEPVTNYTNIEYLRSESLFKEYFFLYKHRIYDFYISTIRDSFYEDNEEYEKVNKDFKKIGLIYYKADSDELYQVINSLNEVLDFEYESQATVNLVLKTNKGFEFKEVPIKPLPLDIDKMYNDDFKPVYEHLVEHLNTGTKGIALLHGAAGTGKSNLIRHLTKVVPDKRFVFVPVNMISFLTDPMFLSLLIDNKGAVLVLEDCENYIKDRKGGDAGGVVSTILNLTDGIMSDVLGVQLICTFNNSIKDVDKALLRKGRLICDYEFKPLDIDKTLLLLKDNNVNLGIVPYNMTLSDIYNTTPPTNEQGTKKIGFGSN